MTPKGKWPSSLSRVHRRACAIGLRLCGFTVRRSRRTIIGQLWGFSDQSNRAVRLRDGKAVVTRPPAKCRAFIQEEVPMRIVTAMIIGLAGLSTAAVAQTVPPQAPSTPPPPADQPMTTHASPADPATQNPPAAPDAMPQDSMQHEAMTPDRMTHDTPAPQPAGPATPKTKKTKPR